MTDRGATVRTNPIKNPSFETNITGYLHQGSTSIARSTTEFFIGTASLQCTITSGNRFAIYGATANAGANADSIPVPAFRGLVTFSAYVKWTTTPLSTVAKIHWFNSSGNWISDTDAVGVTPTNNTWTRVSVTGQPPATAVSYGVVLTTTGAGTLYTDAWLTEESPIAGAYFDGETTDTAAYVHSWTGNAHASPSMAVAASTRTNLIVNPSFETGLANWTGASMQRTNTLFAHTGTYAMHFGGGTVYKSADVAATPGLDYAASAWFNKSTTAGRTAAISLHFFDSGGTELSAPTVTETSLANQDVPERRASVRTAPANTANAQVWIHNANSGNTVQCDAVMLEQSPYVGPYFDGTTVANWLPHAWTGTAHASTSTESLASNVRYNLIPNPSFEVDVQSWSNVTRDNSYNNANVAGGWVGVWNGASVGSKSASVPVTAGLDYTASAWCTKVTSSARSCAISLHFFNSAGAEIDAPTTTLTPIAVTQTPERRSHTRTAPVGAVTAQVWYERDSSLQAFDAVMLEQSSTVNDYFDGSWAPAGMATGWLGTVHNSPSMLAPMTTQSVRIKTRDSGGWNPRAAVARVRIGNMWKVAVPKRWDGAAWVDLP